MKMKQYQVSIWLCSGEERVYEVVAENSNAAVDASLAQLQLISLDEVEGIVLTEIEQPSLV